MTLIYNASLEEIPPFGICQISGGMRLRGGEGTDNTRGRYAFDVIKPAGELRADLHLINGGAPVPPRRLGNAAFATQPGLCLADLGETPEFDDDWGPVSGSWKLGSTGTGFRVLSHEPDQERIICMMQIGPQLFMAQTTAAITAPNTGTFNRLSGTKGSESEITDDSVSAYDRFGDVSDDTKAVIAFVDGGWEQIVGECP